MDIKTDSQRICCCKELIKKYNVRGKRIHDANIVATMLCNEIKIIFTKNLVDFKVFKEIQIIT